METKNYNGADNHVSSVKKMIKIKISTWWHVFDPKSTKKEH